MNFLKKLFGIKISLETSADSFGVSVISSEENFSKNETKEEVVLTESKKGIDLNFDQDVLKTKTQKEINPIDLDIEYVGKWGAEDMKYVQIWNPSGVHNGNFTKYALIYWSPDYTSTGDENGGRNNYTEEAIILTINLEEGLVYPTIDSIRTAAHIFNSKEEALLFFEKAQKKFDEELDFKNGHFRFGYGGCDLCLREHDNANIEYLPLTFPDTEKFNSPNYRKAVISDLMSKGAIFIKPKVGDSYLAVIQRKNKPRDLKPFKRFLK